MQQVSSNFPNEPQINLKNNAHAFSIKKNKLYSKDEKKTLEELARECRKRGNRLEVMNGKVYEVTRKLIREIE